MAFSGKREEASKVDLCKQMEAFESDLNINILTKPIGFQPSEESLAVAAAQKLKNLEEIVYVTPFPSKVCQLLIVSRGCWGTGLIVFATYTMVSVLRSS